VESRTVRTVPAAVEVFDLTRHYPRGDTTVRALDSVTFSVDDGEFVAFTGPSGSGKSTLLHLLGGLDRATRGTIRVGADDLGALDEEALSTYRRRRVGFVFQMFQLLPELTAWENVALPLVLDGITMHAGRARAIELLDHVGLDARSEHRPGDLSGGEQQRVAIARALVADPTLVLADEPTGNLDAAAGDVVVELLQRAAVGGQRTVVMATHDPHVAAKGHRVLALVDGRLIDDEG
jgi:putative ABC transport system ATP-binding protein